MTKKRRRRLHSIIRALHCMFRTGASSRRSADRRRLHRGAAPCAAHAGRGYGKSTVDAMIISAEGKSVYVASDSAPEVSLHESVLHGRRMDAAFWNGEMLLYKPEREALCRFAAQNFIYHIPVTRRTAFGGSWSGCAGAILQSWKPSACWEITHPKSSCNKECRPGKPGRHLKSYSATDQLSPSKKTEA